MPDRLISIAVADDLPLVHFHLPGQMPGGKNQQGRRKGQKGSYPNARFKLWRRDSLLQIAHQRPRVPVAVAVVLEVDYTPGDRHTRDVSGLVDALGHLLEVGLFIANDGLIKGLLWRPAELDRENPGVDVRLWRL